MIFCARDEREQIKLEQNFRFKSESESYQLCLTLCNTRNSPVQNTGMGSLSLFQRIFPTQGSNTNLPHCRQILYQLNHKRSPRILEWQPIPSPADLPDPGIQSGSPALQTDSLPTELSGKQFSILMKSQINITYVYMKCV